MDSSQSSVTYQQGESTVSKINPWILQLSKKNAEKLHKQLIRDEALNVPHSTCDQIFLINFVFHSTFEKANQ